MLSIVIRLAMGRQWLKLLAADGLGGHAASFIAAYGFDEPDPTSRSDAFITAHATVWQSLAAIAESSAEESSLNSGTRRNVSRICCLGKDTPIE